MASGDNSKVGSCFACDRKIYATASLRLVTCADDQTVCVGPECYRLVNDAGADGYQPPKGGPRLFLLQRKPERA